MTAKASRTFQVRGFGIASISVLTGGIRKSFPRLIRSAQATFDALLKHKFFYDATSNAARRGLRAYLNCGGYYFFTRLVWLATQSHRPCSKIHVSVKRPTWSYGLPW